MSTWLVRVDDGDGDLFTLDLDLDGLCKKYKSSATHFSARRISPVAGMGANDKNVLAQVTRGNSGETREP